MHRSGFSAQRQPLPISSLGLSTPLLFPNLSPPLPVRRQVQDVVVVVVVEAWRGVGGAERGPCMKHDAH